MKTLAVLILSLLPVAARAQLTFKDHGKTVRTATLSELSALVAPETVTVLEPSEKKEVRFKAFPVDALFAKVYGDAWKGAEEALFTCTDGYQPSLPAADFSGHRPYLAFARADRAEFSVTPAAGGDKIEVGPFYLIWENLRDASMRENAGHLWPYQVTTVDLIRFADRFPALVPPADAGAAADRGFLQFRKRCQSCHTVNGEGGKKGVELNYPANPTEYWKEDWLKRWITDPKSVRFSTEMHAFTQDSPRWKDDLDDVIAYLKAMTRAKRKPAALP